MEEMHTNDSPEKLCITKISLSKVDYNEANIKDLDSFLNKETINDFVICIAEGTFIHDTNQYNIALNKQLKYMDENQVVISGHIIDNLTSVSIPYMHEQFLILNMQLLNKLTKVKLGPYFNNDNITFPSYTLNREYQGEIKLSNDNKAISGDNNWCTQMMVKALETGFKVTEISNDLKFTKNYASEHDNEYKKHALKKEFDLLCANKFF